MLNPNLVYPVRAGQSIDGEVVRPACKENNGFWFCVTHSKGFHNGWDKDGHVIRGRHRMVWVCNEHGFEQP